MPNGICPKCGVNPVLPKRSYCRECGNQWQNDYKKAHPQIRTEEQIQRQNMLARERINNMTPEARQAYYDRKANTRAKWLARKPEVRIRMNAKAVAVRSTWSKERLERQKQTQKDHYDRRQLRPAKGLCGYSVSCNEPPIGVQRFCLFHWCRAVLMVNGKRISCTPDDLVSLWKRQDGKCAITGLVITPGSTAELDHIVPVYAGGNGAIENLRYVDGMFNRMKSHMTDEDLKKLVPEFCSKMIEWAKK